MNGNYHLPVLLEEVIVALNVKANGIYIDCTIGAGGHSLAILERLGQNGLLIGIDKDADALKIADKRLQKVDKCYHLFHNSYAELPKIINKLNIEGADGILFDLGVSSMQLDRAERGFAFKNNGPLDMRMDQERTGVTAEELVNSLSEEELADCFWRYGEERYARKIAFAIVKARRHERIRGTKQLAEIIEEAIGHRAGTKIHPATRVFQALRIKVNDELAELEQGLEDAFNVLNSNGRLAVISYHSLEDRIVKQKFLAHCGKEVSLQEGGSRWQGMLPRGRVLNKKPIVPKEDEVKSNPRSRSAKLRVFERI